MDRSASRAPAVLRPFRARWWWMAALTAIACDHSTPFQPPSDAPDGPRDAALPRQVTFSTDPDLTPARAADGGWLYAYTERTQAGINRCIAGLPLEGGSRTRSYCDVTLGKSGVNSTVTWPAESPDGKLAYFRTRGVGHGGAQLTGALVLGSFAPRDSGRILRSLPYPTSSVPVRSISHLNWLDSHTLIFLANRIEYLAFGMQGFVDTLEGGLQIELFDIDHPPTTPDIMPGTTLASSVEPTPDGKGFYFTLAGDSLVYHRDLASGATATVFDFAARGIARDVQIADSVLYAIVGGDVQLVVNDTVGILQEDYGGKLMHVDLRSGTADSIRILGLPMRYPSLHSGSHRLLVQVGNPTSDLWLVETP